MIGPKPITTSTCARRAARPGSGRGRTAPPPEPAWRTSPNSTPQIATLAAELADHFEQHPDSDIYLLARCRCRTRSPGARRVRGRPEPLCRHHVSQNYAGTSPITRASARDRSRSPDSCATTASLTPLDQWAFSSNTASPGARTFYDQRRAAGDSHHKALRALANRWFGILHGCLHHRTRYDETIAWAYRIDTDLKKIAQAA